MRPWLKTASTLVLALSLAGPVVRAQDEEAPPAPDTEDNWRYTSPGPAKCVEIGNYYLRRRKLKAALSRFQEAVQTNPHYPPAYLGLGKVYERMGLKQKALDAYKRYLDELPSTKEAEQAKDVRAAIARLQSQVRPTKP